MAKWDDGYKMCQCPPEGEYKEYRFILSKIQNKGGKTLIAFGMNSSTANIDEDDPTLRNLDTIANSNEYDNWIMLNVFPMREQKSALLKALVQDERSKRCIEENIEHIKFVLKDYPDADVLLGWGCKTASWFKAKTDEIEVLLVGRNVYVIDNKDHYNKKDEKPYHFGTMGLNNSLNKKPNRCEPEDIKLRKKTIIIK